MIQRDVVFDALPSVTPNFAAKLANCASAYSARTWLNCNGTVLCMDSLISILSLALRRGTAIGVSAEGEDAQAAVDAVCALLTTRVE